MGRISVVLPITVCVALAIGITHGHFVGHRNLQQTSSNGVPVTVVYGQDQYMYPQQYQYQQYSQSQPQLLRQQQPQLLQTHPSMLAARQGRSYTQELPRARLTDEESGYEDDQEYQEDEHEPLERRKKKKKKTEESFPRRVIKKTRNAIGAVLGAPKYIYTRYKDTYGSGSSKKEPEKRKEKRKESKGGKGYDKGWGWESGYEEYDHDHPDDGDDRWGWDSRRSSTSGRGSEDDYERKSGKRSTTNPEYNNYKYNTYLYKQPAGSSSRQDRQMPVSNNYNSWTG